MLDAVAGLSGLMAGVVTPVATSRARSVEPVSSRHDARPQAQDRFERSAQPVRDDFTTYSALETRSAAHSKPVDTAASTPPTQTPPPPAPSGAAISQLLPMNQTIFQGHAPKAGTSLDVTV
jgi:hypothetical protein